MIPEVGYHTEGMITLPTLMRLSDDEVKYVADAIVECWEKFGSPDSNDGGLFSDDE